MVGAPRVDEPSELAALLKATTFAGREIRALPILDTSLDALVVLLGQEAATDEGFFRAWEACRALLPQTGRWPLAVSLTVADWRPDDAAPMAPDLFSRQFYGGDATNNSPPAILELAAKIDPRAIDLRLNAEFDSAALDPLAATDAMLDDWRSTVSNQLAWTEYMVGAAPVIDDVLREVPLFDAPELERLLGRWEASRSHRDDVLLPIDAENDQCQAIAFLPCSVPESTAAYAHWYGGGESPERQAELIAHARGWREQFDLEWVANDGVVLTAVMRRPPSDFETALELALELTRYWQWSHSIRELARALIDRTIPIGIFARP